MAHSTAIRQKLRIGTRASRLARWQADWVARQLDARGHEVEIVELTTRGDSDSRTAIGNIGTVGVFTKEIQRALLAGEVDLAVHSLKDLPTEVAPNLVLGAVPEREDPADVLVSNQNKTLSTLAPGARVGTGSPRRQAQIRHARPDLEVTGIRGNVDTRLAKLDDGQFDAIVLAGAGLRRLGLTERITEVLSLDIMLPAVGQGALGIECRGDDQATLASIAPLDHSPTRAAVIAERALLAELRGGCLAPVGAWGRIEGDTLRLRGIVLSDDGTIRIEANDSSTPGDSASLGKRVAAALLARGAGDLIRDVRNR